VVADSTGLPALQTGSISMKAGTSDGPSHCLLTRKLYRGRKELRHSSFSILWDNRELRAAALASPLFRRVLTPATKATTPRTRKTRDRFRHGRRRCRTLPLFRGVVVWIAPFLQTILTTPRSLTTHSRRARHYLYRKTTRRASTKALTARLL